MTSPSDMLRMVGDGMHVARAIYSSSDDESEVWRLVRRAMRRGVALSLQQLVHAAHIATHKNGCADEIAHREPYAKRVAKWEASSFHHMFKHARQGITITPHDRAMADLAMSLRRSIGTGGGSEDDDIPF